MINETFALQKLQMYYNTFLFCLFGFFFVLFFCFLFVCYLHLCCHQLIIPENSEHPPIVHLTFVIGKLWIPSVTMFDGL